MEGLTVNLDMKLLEKLCLIGGISGDEKNVADEIINEVSKLDAQYYKDNFGNVIVFKKGKNRPKTRVMLAAHMDEVGLIVTHITDDGYLGFDMVGGIEINSIVGINVLVGKNKLPGVIGIKPIHLLKKADLSGEIKLEDLFIDIGAKDVSDAKKYVNIGDSVIFSSIFDSSNNKILSKALDDRLGCFILLNILKQNLDFDACFAFTTQEEIGLRGAMVATYSVDPQAAIIVEATTANDIPGAKQGKKICELGHGPALSFMDRRNVYDKEYYELAMSIAKLNNIKIQPKKGTTGGNDAGAISVSKGGVRTLALSVPCRYLHTGTGIIYKSDLEETLKIVPLILKEISSKQQ